MLIHRRPLASTVSTFGVSGCSGGLVVTVPRAPRRRRGRFGLRTSRLGGHHSGYLSPQHTIVPRCFGPLEVSYAERTTADVGEIRRRIQGGPQNIWRYADFLPLEAPPGPSVRSSSRIGLPAGCTPLIKADRLAERLGLGEVWVKNDAANPTHSFKDRVVSVATARARELGYGVIACASTGNLANSVAAHGAALGLESYVFIPADLEEQKVLATGIYGTKVVAVEGNYDEVNRLCTELCADRDWAFLNINLRPYYAE